MSLLRQSILWCIGAYQHLLSPDHSIWAKALGRPPYCRHVPTCSQYAHQAFSTHGVRRGGFLSIRRVLSCHPWAPPRFDPVPPVPPKPSCPSCLSHK